jgi:hypothetical protein
MKTKDLYNYVLKNNGATYDPRNENIFDKTSGFMVSIPGYEQKLYLDDVDVETFGATLASLYPSSSEYIGIWINEGIMYFDISEHIEDLEEAILCGIKNEQIAIWNIHRSESILLPTPQKTGTMTQQSAYISQVVSRMIDSYPTCIWY